jgi:hypothetical protein
MSITIEKPGLLPTAMWSKQFHLAGILSSAGAAVIAQSCIWYFCFVKSIDFCMMLMGWVFVLRSETLSIPRAGIV